MGSNYLIDTQAGGMHYKAIGTHYREGWSPNGGYERFPNVKPKHIDHVLVVVILMRILNCLVIVVFYLHVQRRDS